jgi:hypothetical protein
VMDMAQDMELGLQIEIQGPDGIEQVYRAADGQAQQYGNGTRVGWDLPGMEPVGELMRENPDHKNFAQEIMNNVLSKSTIQSYQGAIRKYQDFCDSVHHDQAEFSEKILLHYLTFLLKNNASIAMVKQVKPAISLLLDMYGGGKSVFTDKVDRWLSAVKRLAAKRKPPPTRKAGQVTLQDLKDIVMLVVIPHRDSITGIHPTQFRTVIRLDIIYLTFC